MPDGANRFVWISDVHRSKDPSFAYVPAHINTLNAECVVDTGDVTSIDWTNAFNTYKAEMETLTAPWYVTPGNHDQGANHDYAEYDAVIGMDHFAVTVGPVRLIGFKTTTLPDTSLIIEQDEVDFITAELAALDGLVPVAMTHNDIQSVLMEGGGNINTLLAEGGFKAVLHGDLHQNCITKTVLGMLYVSGGSCNATITGDETNTDGGMMVCDVYDDRMEIIYTRARWGWDRFRETNSGIANDVKYIPITISLL